MALNGQKVLVLNRAYVATNIIGWQRAIMLVLLEKAELVSEHPELDIPTIRRRYPLPSVIRLLIYSGFPRFTPRFTRRNVYLRDEYTCQYCGVRYDAGRLNLDHVIPLSRKGMTGWKNVVCSCLSCNLKKRNRLPHEVGMKLVREPRAPGNYMLYRLRGMQVPEDWGDFVYWGKPARVPAR